MARRADHSREQLKEIAIAKGYELIKAEGYKEFSTRKLAKEIGYTVGTIYNMFKDYDDLILHINAVTYTNWAAEMEALLQKTQTNKLEALAKFYIKYSSENYNLWITLFEHHMPKERLPSWYKEKLGRLFATLEAVLAEETTLKGAELQQAAQTCWAGIHGIAILSLTHKLNIYHENSPEKLAIGFVRKFLGEGGSSAQRSDDVKVNKVPEKKLSEGKAAETKASEKNAPVQKSDKKEKPKKKETEQFSFL